MLDRCFFFQAEDGIRDVAVTGVQTCALPICSEEHHATLEMPHPIVIYSRTVLNGMLLDRARDAGCNVQRSRVMSVDTSTTKPRYCVEGDWQEADFLEIGRASCRERV